MEGDISISDRRAEWKHRQDAYRRERPPTRWFDDIERIHTNWIKEVQIEKCGSNQSPAVEKYGLIDDDDDNNDEVQSIKIN